MATTHKTFSGMRRAIERLVDEIENCPATSTRESRDYCKRANPLIAECAAAWTDDAQASEAARLKNRLIDVLSANT